MTEQTLLLHVNREGCALFGEDSESLTGRPLEEVFEKLGGVWLNIMRDRGKKCIDQRISLESGEMPIPTTVNGTERFLTATFAPILQDHGASGGVVVLHDVTQKHLLSQEQMRRNKIDSVGVEN